MHGHYDQGAAAALELYGIKEAGIGDWLRSAASGPARAVKKTTGAMALAGMLGGGWAGGQVPTVGRIPQAVNVALGAGGGAAGAIAKPIYSGAQSVRQGLGAWDTAKNVGHGFVTGIPEGAEAALRWKL